MAVVDHLGPPVAQVEGLAAPGWSAPWLNGWMAAVGALRNTGLRLSFTSELCPVPVFTRADGTAALVADVADALPSPEDLASSVLAKERDDLPTFPRKPSVESYAERARWARWTGDRMLGATVTDLVAEDELAHSPFDPPVPRGLTVWDRAVACRELIEDVETAVSRSMSGTLARVSTNGLGFDARRITVSSAANSAKLVDPVVELLAFASLPMFSIGGSGGASGTCRGWVFRPTRPLSFTWPVWRQPLSWAGVDHLLDEFWAERPLDDPKTTVWERSVRKLGVFGAYGSVPYAQTGAMDSTRGYASDLLWMRP